MDGKLMGLTKSVMGKGEKVAPVDSVKLKVKFQKVLKDKVGKAKGDKKV
jgi:hypothetical protein